MTRSENTPAFQAAREAWLTEAGEGDHPGINRPLAAAIGAYLTALPKPADDVAGLVARAEGRAQWYDDAHPGTVKTPALLRELAAALSRMSAELEALRVERDDLAREATCHDEELYGWEHDFAKERNRADTAEATIADRDAEIARLREALDALGAPPSLIQRLGAGISRRDWHEVEQAHASIRDTVEAARRALTTGGGDAEAILEAYDKGGKTDG